MLNSPAPLYELGRRLRRDRRRAVAAIEFALVAPVGVVLMIGVFDLARGFIIWERTCNAAEAIAEAAEKLSVTTGSTATSLTATQMQNAMSTVYAQVPGLSLGNGNAASGSSFTVTLSGVVYSPTCATTTGCAAQTPYTAWSTYLTQNGVTLTSPPLRVCGALTKVASFPDDSTQLTKMAYWSSGSIPLTSADGRRRQGLFRADVLDVHRPGHLLVVGRHADALGHHEPGRQLQRDAAHGQRADLHGAVAMSCL